MIDAEPLGPPDIERKVGLTGGHIFQGECLPALHVEQPAFVANADGGRLSLRRLHASWRQRHRNQRTKCS